MHLRYCTVETVEQLRRTVTERLDWYFTPDGGASAPSYLGGFRETTIQAPQLADKLTIDEQHPFKTDAQNALVVYKSLENLTPHQAAIERMWVYLTHFDCPRYVSARWLRRRPEDDGLAARKVSNHFFATGNRGVIRDNGVSRLWWLGKIAHEIDPDDPLQFLTLLLHRQDVRSALIERPSVSMNQRLLRAIYRVMLDHWENGGTLFKRETFRRWMISLNRRGGVILLDALPTFELVGLLQREAVIAVSETEGK